ncbi:MAG: galactokinase [Clostridiales bacterium]|nr:galactokinase [Clostridiales bacterium]
MNAVELIKMIESGDADTALKRIYVTDEAVEKQKPRYIKTAKKFISLFGGDRDVIVLSAPGRTEICGNHTDHNNGKVLAASINLDAIAVAAESDNKFVIREKSEGHPMNTVDLSDEDPNPADYGKSSSMIKGMAVRLRECGFKTAGFDACTTNDVMGGSGLSSSAAFEVLIGAIISHLFNGGNIDSITIAKSAQYSENVFFGKPSGLLDQTASAVGSFVTIDFKSTENPIIKKVNFDFEKSNHALCIVDTHGNHSDLTDDYATVRSEMEAVARAMGHSVLREIDYNDFLSAVPQLTKKVNDRALLRAMHFFNENIRVEKAVESLEDDDFDSFKGIITQSGLSAFMNNQNVYTPKNSTEQKLSLALCLSQQILEGRGAWRVHGGGFAGTIQAFVPLDMLDEYRKLMDSVFGKGSCYVLIIRPVGETRVI